MLDYDNARSSYYKVCNLYALEKKPAALVVFFSIVIVLLWDEISLIYLHIVIETAL